VLIYEAPCLALEVIETVNQAVMSFAETKRYDTPIGQQTAPTHQAA
jgi:hypothetical protein